MNYCPKCKVSIRGSKRCCPLCQGTLTAQDTRNLPDTSFMAEDAPAFPILPGQKVSRLSAFKLITFIFVAGEIVFGGLHILTGRQMHWITLVMLLILVGWVDLCFFMYIRNNILKVVSTEILAGLLITILVDINTGFHGWSLAWALPSGLVGHALIIFILAKALRLHLQDYIIYFLLGYCVSMLQIIPLALHLNPVRLPAIISIMVFLILFAGTLIFGYRELKAAYARRFNF